MQAMPFNPVVESLMRKLENRCAHCGGKFGLIYHHHWGLRFCRKSCKEGFLAKAAKDHARMRKWFGRADRPRNRDTAGDAGDIRCEAAIIHSAAQCARTS
jgi:hypothetical protein